MAKYLAMTERWIVPEETSGSIQNIGDSVIEVSAEDKFNTGVRIGQNQMIAFDGTVYVRSMGSAPCAFTTVPFNVKGKGGDTQPYEEIYSTTERKIGKWVDEKELYQRTFVVKSPDKVGETKLIFDTTDSNIDIVTNFRGIVSDGNTVFYNLNSSYADGGRLDVETWYTQNEGFKMIVSSEKLLNLDAYITFQYTKKLLDNYDVK